MGMTRKSAPGRSRARSAAVLLKYVLLQLPGLGFLIIAFHYLQDWIHLPSWAIWLICLLWVAKDVALYPFVWRAYDWGGRHEDSLIGVQGVTREALTPFGYVEVRGELWRAQSKDGRSVIPAGLPVKVYERDGLTLTVEPLEIPSAEAVVGKR